MTPTIERVDPGEWRSALTARHADGFTYLDLLTGIEQSDGVEVVVVLLDPVTRATCAMATIARDARVDSVAELFAGAAWHERETAEFFGITFVGHPDPRALVTRRLRPPLMAKSTPLPVRVQTPWPGAEPGRRRAARPPGVLDTWEDT